MAKFICQEVETVDDYDEYCHYVAGLEKVPILIAFHRHIYDTDWHYSCKSEESLNIFIFHIPLIFDCLTDKFYLFNFRWYEGVQDSNGPISPCFCSFFGT
jgi:hypothetical protein